MLTLSLLFCMGIPLAAQARYSDNNNITLQLTFSSGGANCYTKIVGSAGTTSITNCTMTLKDSSGTVVKTWSSLPSTGGILIASKTATGVTKGKTYTLSISATVNRNGTSERVSDSVTATY